MESTMAYRHDKDFQCTNEELNDLVYCLSKDEYDEGYWAEALPTYTLIK